jgi:hypothetical protein
MSVLTDLRRPITERITISICRADNDKILYTHQYYVAIDREFAKRIIGMLDYADIEYGTRTYAVMRNDEGRILNPIGGYWHATTRESRRYRKAN